uniref:Cation-transporting P-type ATPase N-terminal domain-containing protein n=1 Tax=Periophthalmus magnuspinnatus TaxID=409849 RepID=A0A3B3ZS56_9GOBI
DARGYKWVRWRVWLCRVLALLTGGLLALLFYWRPRLGVLARGSPCPLAMADVLLIQQDSGNKQHVVKVHTEEMEEGLGELDDNESRDTVQLYQQDQKTLLRYYILDGLRYVWLDRKESFVRVILNEDWTCQDLHGFQKGLSPQEQIFRRVYGSNLIDVPVKSYIQLLFEEVLNPFYIFQLASIILWMSDHYYYYAVCIIVISLISIGVSLYEIRKQSVTLHNMARLVVDVKIRKSSGEQIVSSVDLVPGDCVLIPAEGLLLPCDAALLSGECLVNESMLTESVPVLKTPLPAGDQRYNSETERRYTLFCGTQVIQGKGGGLEGSPAVAVVTSTFFTAKGNLVSSILYPQDSDFRFNRDASKFLLFLGVICMGTIYSILLFIKYNDIFVRSLDIVTIVVPPALPAAITTATIYAQKRLKNLNVFCISPPRINISGKVSVFCFDKTGTLTEDGLDVWGIMEGNSVGFSELVPDPSLLHPGPMLSALACCHTLTLLHGNPVGDPLELKMVESTGWTLDEPLGNRHTTDSEFGGHRILAMMNPPSQKHTTCVQALAIVRRFAFSSALQRMSVVTVTPGRQSVVAFLKGSPEMVASLCKEETPAQFTTTLSKFSKDGLRVLALGYKPIALDMDLNTIQEEVEKDLHFLGLLMMKNLVKTETPGVINMLKLACLRTIMVTDNILTAVNVAKNCGMIGSDERVIFVKASPHTGLYQSGYNYHLAINGKSFAALSDYFPEELPKVLMRTTVFARMAPNQKTQLVKELRKLYRVGMCGDGANDCGALRAADVGISLSEAEASVASPFTSKIQNISCVPLLIREGRCSLVTSFSLFRYVAMYSLIQFCSVLILYTMRTNLADLQFLFFDLVLVTVLAIVMGKGGPSNALHTSRPPASLWSLPVLGSLLIHTLLIILGQTGVILFTRAQDYVPLNGTTPGENNWPNIEDTSLFAVSGFQYIFMAVVVTKAHPHKKPLYHNWFLILLVLFSGLMIWLVMYPLPFVRVLLSLYNVEDMSFKFVLVGFSALNFFTCLLMEQMLIDLGLLNSLRLLRGRRQSKKPYKRLDSQLSESSSWPPLNQTLLPSHNIVRLLS